MNDAGAAPESLADRRWLVVSLHDVAPCTGDISRAWMRHLEARRIVSSLLVVPGPWRRPAGLSDDPELVAWLHEMAGAGHEIVQHGWDHHGVPHWASTRRGPRVRAVQRLVARGCGEFWTIDAGEARRRLLLGRDMLDAVGLTAQGFVAPAWLLSPEARAAVAEVGFRYTTTHRHVIDYTDGRTIGCLALSQRAQHRLAGLAATVSLAGVRRAVSRSAPLRIAVHPDDLADRRALSSVLAACDLAVEAGYRTLTYGQLVDGYSRPQAIGSAAHLSRGPHGSRGRS